MTVALFQSQTFAEPVAGILAAHTNTLLGLTRSGQCDSRAARLLASSSPASLFAGGRHPEAALSGLLLRLDCWDESHHISQDISAAEGSYWHAIAHRLEPDSWNSGYWFRRVGEHPVFDPLHRKASELLQTNRPAGWSLKPRWDPFLFIEWCDEARSTTDPAKKQTALQIQMAEWELLFHWCAAPPDAWPPEAL